MAANKGDDQRGELARLRRELAIARQQLYELQWTSTTLLNLVAASDEWKPCLREVLDLGRLLVQSECAYLMLYDADAGELRLALHSERPEGGNGFAVQLDAGHHMGRAVIRGHPIIQKSPRKAPVPRVRRQRELRNLLTVPLKGSGGTVGTLTLLNRLPSGDYTKPDGESLQVYGSTAAIVIERARMTEDLRWFADHDGMTQLYRRDRLPYVLNSLVTNRDISGDYVHFMLADLDGFKEVNDTLGHQRGDDLIVEIARELMVLTEPPNMLGCHWGGDEFVVCCISHSTGDAAGLGATMRAKMEAASNRLDDVRPFKVTASVGYSTSDRGDAKYDDLAKRADDLLIEEEKKEKLRLGLRRPRCCRETPAA